MSWFNGLRASPLSDMSFLDIMASSIPSYPIETVGPDLLCHAMAFWDVIVR